MKLLLLTLSFVGCSLAEAPYPASGDKPQGALLLLPPDSRQPSTTWSSFQAGETEDLSKVNDKVMQRLRQEVGSDSGSYHVYLGDGRLQKVQYTTAPVQSGQQLNSFSGNQRYSGQYEQGSFGSEGGFSGSSPVTDNSEAQRFSSDQGRQLSERYPSNQNSEFPTYSERQQNFGAQAYSGRQQNGQYESQQVSEAHHFSSEQGSQLNGRYSDQDNSEVEGYTQRQQSFGPQAYSGRLKNGQYSGRDSEELNPVIAQFGRLQQELQQKQIQQLQQRQQQLELEQQKLQNQQEQLRSANYVASLQYSNVEPITSPVYSYKPSPVTRILRYAPEY